MNYDYHIGAETALEIAAQVHAGKDIRVSHPSAQLGDVVRIVFATDPPKPPRRSFVVTRVHPENRIAGLTFSPREVTMSILDKSE